MKTYTIEVPTPEDIRPHVIVDRAYIEHIISSVRELMIEKPVSLKGAADYMSLHPKSLIKQISKEVFPAKLVHKSGGRLYFFLSEIREYLKQL